MVFINTAVTSGGVLTESGFLKAIRAMKTQRAALCGVDDPHIVSPAAHRRGYGVCASCGKMVGDWPQDVIDRMWAADEERYDLWWSRLLGGCQ